MGRWICAKQTLRAPPGSGGHSEREAVLPAERNLQEEKKRGSLTYRGARVSSLRFVSFWLV